MRMRMVGCSHHNTPVEVREKFSFTDQQSDVAANLLRDQFSNCESVLLSTCNRVELYVGTDSEVQTALPSCMQLVEFIAKFHGLQLPDYENYFLKLETESTLLHLFSVASSIDSLVVGESQIVSQVHEAYERSVKNGFAGPTLHKAFQHAAQTAKRVTNETEIHRRRISVPSIAVSEIASAFFERFDDKKVVLIGSGEMGRETLQYLKAAGALSITVVNRSVENGRRLADEFHVAFEPWDKLDGCIAEADLVVSTTGATEPIMNETRFKQLLEKRTKGTLLILDLAVPRDFEPSIGRLPDIYLYTVDDLQAVCDRNKLLREQQLPKAKRIVQEEVDRLIQSWKQRSSGDTIRALRDWAMDIRESELSRLFSKQSLQNSPEEVQKEIEHAFDRLVNKLLNQPLQSIREVAHDEQHDSLVSALRKLFRIR